MMMSRLIDEGALSKTRKDSEEVNVDVAGPVGAIGARGSTFEGGRFPTTKRMVTDRTGTMLDERSNESRRSRSKSGDRRPTRSRSRPPRRGWGENVDPPLSAMETDDSRRAGLPERNTSRPLSELRSTGPNGSVKSGDLLLCHTIAGEKRPRPRHAARSEADSAEPPS